MLPLSDYGRSLVTPVSSARACSRLLTCGCRRAYAKASAVQLPVWFDGPPLACLGSYERHREQSWNKTRQKVFWVKGTDQWKEEQRKASHSHGSMSAGPTLRWMRSLLRLKYR